MTVPVYQAIGTAASAFSTTAPDDVLIMSVPWPTHIAGDIGIFVIYDDNAAISSDIDPFDGWTLIDNSGASTAARIKAFWKRAASSAEGDVNIAAVSGGLPNGSNCHGVIITYRGCVPSGNPIDVTTSTTRTTSTSCTFPSVTTITPDCMVLLLGARDNDNASAAWSAQTNAALGSITERYDAGTVVGNGGGLSITEGTKAAAGATGTTSSTVTSSAGGMITCALRSAAPQSTNYFFGAP